MAQVYAFVDARAGGVAYVLCEASLGKRRLERGPSTLAELGLCPHKKLLARTRSHLLSSPDSCADPLVPARVRLSRLCSGAHVHTRRIKF